CPPHSGAPINVKVRAEKQSFFWTIPYTSDSTTVSKPYDFQTMTLTRNNMFRRPSYKSNISVQMRPYSGAVPGGAGTNCGGVATGPQFEPGAGGGGGGGGSSATW